MMTEKRFEINNEMTLDNKVETYKLSCLVDNDNKTFYFIVDSIANVESFVERLNELHEENKDLKAFNQDLSEELSVCANARISKDYRIERLEEKIQRERTSFTKTHERWSKEAETKIKELSDENEQLKKEVEMLRNGLKAYNEALPLYLDCEDIMHFKSELYEFEMERMDFYKKYPNRVHYSRGDFE